MSRESAILRALKCVVALAFSGMACCNALAAETVRIGFWTSGASLGFGTVLENTDFPAMRGINATYVHFSDVNAPVRALATGSIDIAFGAPAAGVFSASAEGVPIKIFAATQPADVQFVVRTDSRITSIVEFRGKKLGMSPSGSSVAVIAGTLLAGNYGIRAEDYSVVGGSESRVVQFLLQEQVDGAVLRSLTIDQLPDELKVRSLGSFADEWQKLTKTKVVPYIGVGAVRSKLVDEHPETVVKVILGLRDALVWGASHRDAIVNILQREANLSEKAARVYADRWEGTTRLSFDPADIDALRAQQELFVASGLIRGEIRADLFAREPYARASKQK